MSMKVYISGKISGLEKSVYEQFFKEAEAHITSLGHTPVNPCTIHECEYTTWEEYMIADIKALFDCEGIFMLSNWRGSRGARIEHAIAIEKEMKIFYQ